MKKFVKPIFLGGFTMFMLLINIQYSNAHQWSNLHWDKSTLGVAIWNCVSEANDTRSHWDVHTDLSLPRQYSHTDISMDCKNYGNTGWSGLATIVSKSFDFWHCFGNCRIEHAHAVVNTYYASNNSWSHRRGVFCQELGHTFGLTHSNTGDCMGLTYYNNSTVSGPHNWADINNMY